MKWNLLPGPKLVLLSVDVRSVKPFDGSSGVCGLFSPSSDDDLDGISRVIRPVDPGRRAAKVGMPSCGEHEVKDARL